MLSSAGFAKAPTPLTLGIVWFSATALQVVSSDADWV